ncbi:hypothetical protein [Pseudomonas putida]|uniref:hypothetical protein n=1 Tax=Pseudomonas putida TaxID=303 RepID=UPI00352A3674
MSRVPSARIELLRSDHLGHAALLIAARATRDQVVRPVVVGMIVEMINVHVIPGNRASAPMACERAIAVLGVIDNPMFVHAITDSTQRVIRCMGQLVAMIICQQPRLETAELVGRSVSALSHVVLLAH